MRHHLDALYRLLTPDAPPAYWLMGSDDLPKELILPSAAFTGRNLDIAYRAWLESAGRWRGRSAVIVLDDSGVRNALRDGIPAETNFAGQLRLASEIHQVLATAIHEIAHVAELGIDTSEAPDVKYEQVVAAMAVCRAETKTARYPKQDRHSPVWLRLVVHAWHRATKAHYTVTPENIFPDRLGPTPKIANAILALHPELDALLNVPLMELCHVPAASAFVEMWKFKLSSWRKRQLNEDAEADRIVAEYLQLLDAHTTTAAPIKLPTRGVA